MLLIISFLYANVGGGVGQYEGDRIVEGSQPIKVRRNRDYLKATADDICSLFETYKL